MVRIRWGKTRKNNKNINNNISSGYDDVFSSVFKPIESKRKVVSDDVVVDPDPMAWLNNTNRIHGIGGLIVKPCHMTGFCPYGQLVEAFPLRENKDYFSCNLFGHDCPVFYHAESVTENDIDRVLSDYNEKNMDDVEDFGTDDTFEGDDDSKVFSDDDNDVVLDTELVDSKGSSSSPTPITEEEEDVFNISPPSYDNVIGDIDRLINKKKLDGEKRK